MIRILISIFIASIIWTLNFNNNSNAQEIVLCLDVTEQTVMRVDARGECLDAEREMVLSGPGTDAWDGLVPLVKFSPTESCQTEGVRYDFGFDKNGDGALARGEIISTSEECKSTPGGE